MIRVVLADDQFLVRAGFSALLASTDDIEVVGEAEDGADAVRTVKDTVPDVVLMDIRMPVQDGLAATRTLVADPLLEHLRVIILTTYAEDEYIFDAIRAGASGFLVKDTRPAELLHAVRVVHAGEALLSPTVTRRLIEEFAVRAKPPGEPTNLRELTDREREVLTLVACGLSNTDIARQLFISPTTAKTHVSRTMIKLRVRDRAQLVVIGYESGLVRPGWMG